MSRFWFWVVLFVLLLATLACGAPARQRSDSDSGPEGIDGQKLYQNFGCSGCHSDSNQAPSLAGLHGTEETLENGETVTVDDAYLRESILDPGAKIVKGYKPIMPSYDPQLDDEEVAALVDYIRSLD